MCVCVKLGNYDCIKALVGRRKSFMFTTGGKMESGGPGGNTYADSC